MSEIQSARHALERPTETLAAYFCGLQLKDVPVDVRQEAKRFILDMVACVVAAARTEIGPLTRTLAAAFGSSDEASVAGSTIKASVLAASYANGRLGNCMDYEEAYPAGVHFGCGAFAAALALAESRKLDGADFLLAAIAGYELGARVSEAAGALMKVEDGKVTGLPDVWGIATPVVFAAAGAAAKILRYDVPLTEQAYGLAGAGTPLPTGAKWSVQVDLPNTKYCDTGWCTLAGVFGAVSASEGSRGLPGIMDGERGLFRMAGIQQADIATLVGSLGQRWMIRDIMYKPWPCCRWMHYPMTAMRQLLRQHEVDPAQVQEVVVETNACAMSQRFLNPEPVNFTSRQFSYPHAVAMMLVDVPPGPGWLSSESDDLPHVRRLRHATRIVEHPRGSAFLKDMEASGDRIVRYMPSAVVVKTINGDSYRVDEELAWGDPWHAHTRWGDEEIAQKVRGFLPAAAADELLDKIDRLEEQPDVEFLAQVLRQACLQDPAARQAAPADASVS